MSKTTTRELRPHVTRRFAGLSDRPVVSKTKRQECVDLQNVEFFRRAAQKRAGFQRQHTNVLRDASVRLNGTSQYLKIKHDTSYQWSNRGFVAIDVTLRDEWSSTLNVYIASKGSGSGSSRFFAFSYDASIGSNGGWRAEVYDNTAATLRSHTIEEEAATADESILNVYRRLEFVYSGSGDVYTFQVFKDDGTGTLTSIGTDSVTVQAWATNTDPWVLGAESDGSGGFQNYANCTVAEFKLGDGTGAPPASITERRELADSGAPGSTEQDELVGYWKLNDGRGSELSDEISTNNGAIIALEGPSWVTDPSLILGGSGVQFHGESGYVHVYPADPSFLWDNIANGGPTDNMTWVSLFIFTPKLAVGESVVRDATVFWSGADGASTPAPFGVKVVSDQLRMYYRDTSGVVSTDSSITGGLSSFADQRLRVLCRKNEISGNPNMQLNVLDETGTAHYGSATNLNASRPGNVSVDWSIGALFTNVTAPATVSEHLYSIVDDVAFIRIDASAAPTSPVSSIAGLTEVGSGILSPFLNNPVLTHYLRFNEGAGTILNIEGSPGGAAFLVPGPEGGARWDVGLVDPYTSPEVTFLRDYARIGPQGGTIRSKLAMSGCTLYELSEGSTTAVEVATGFHKGGQWTAAQYDRRLYLASANGYRPRNWDGASLNWTGIAAPPDRPLVTTGTSGGSLADGTYHIYVTFRNRETGAESNPSQFGVDSNGVAASISGGSGNGKIDSVTIPTAQDPQVNQRRIWITAANGGDGSTAYLAATVEDNSTTTYTTDITSVDTTAVSLEYTDNLEAPPGSIVAVFRDRLFVAGEPSNPTFVYFSGAGTPWAFSASNFLETTRDSGDPVTALTPDFNDLEVHLRDGRKSLVPTADANDPFLVQNLPFSQAAVGPNAVATVDGNKYFLAEEDFVIGGTPRGDVSLSSPPDEDLPSIESTVRDKILPSRKTRAVVRYHAPKRQLWIAYSSDQASGRHDRVLVYNLQQGVWTLYKMEMDFLAGMEDSSDELWLYGASQGFIVKVDTGIADGIQSSKTVSELTGTATGGSTSTLVDSGQSWSTNEFRGLTVYWFDSSATALRSAQIRSNTGTTLTFYSTVAAAPASSDTYWIGGIPWSLEFYLNFGDSIQKKRVGWMKLIGEGTANGGTAPRLRVTLQNDDLGDVASWSSPAVDRSVSWTTSKTEFPIRMGGLGRHFRLRISDSGVSSPAAGEVIPTLDGDVRVHEFRVEAEEVGVL